MTNMMNTSKEELRSVADMEQQEDQLERAIGSLLRKARKAQTAVERLNYECSAQVNRKKLRAVRIKKYKLIDSIEQVSK
jgi:hypothetical protein